MDFAGLNWSSAVFALSVGNFAAAARAAPVRPGEGDGWRGGSAVNNMGKYTKKSKGIERDDDGWEPGLACQEGKGEIKIVRSTAERDCAGSTQNARRNDSGDRSPPTGHTKRLVTHGGEAG
ncbi:uncharacterized protein IUM83_01996 [Phytophthora cinnamomi]|uniref:uncharacterized protein n=1 Tax=Phytophthora cinnamomi TaxID=4785 RepID=UPI00355A4A91|nr:hypothetical protein IUM83_01996 [Phytophthora cinnamomi]